MNPFDLQGPTFLALYVASFCSLLLARFALLAVATRRSVNPEGPKLSPFEIALLSGEDAAAVDAGVASLVRKGRVRAQRVLPVPLVLENVASVFEWPEPELSEAEFLRKLFDATGARWLFDIANLHANVENHGWNLSEFLNRAPLDRIAYAHMAGGRRIGSVYHDTHAHPLNDDTLRTLTTVLSSTGPLPILLERDANFGTRADLEAELDWLALAVQHAGERATHAA